MIFDIKDLDTALKLYGKRSQERKHKIKFNCIQCGKEATLKLRTFRETEKPQLICRGCKCKNNGKIGWGNINAWTPEARKKREETCLEKYGVKNNLSRKEVYNAGIKASYSKESKLKRRNTMIEKFGGPSPLFSSKIKSK